MIRWKWPIKTVKDFLKLEKYQYYIDYNILQIKLYLKQRKMKRKQIRLKQLKSKKIKI